MPTPSSSPESEQEELYNLIDFTFEEGGFRDIADAFLAWLKLKGYRRLEPLDEDSVYACAIEAMRETAGSVAKPIRYGTDAIVARFGTPPAPKAPDDVVETVKEELSGLEHDSGGNALWPGHYAEHLAEKSLLAHTQPSEAPEVAALLLAAQQMFDMKLVAGRWGRLKKAIVAHEASRAPEGGSSPLEAGFNTKCAVHHNEHPDYLCPRHQRVTP